MLLKLEIGFGQAGGKFVQNALAERAAIRTGPSFAKLRRGTRRPVPTQSTGRARPPGEPQSI